MKLSRLSTALLLAGFLTLQPVQSSGPDRMGGYDFSYQAIGDQRVKPVQVFDDGRNTYFQFRSGEPIPAIFVDSSSGTALQMPQIEGPYVKVPTVSGVYSLRLGYSSGRVIYSGGTRGQDAGRLAPVPAVAPVAPAEPVPSAAVQPTPAATAAAVSGPAVKSKVGAYLPQPPAPEAAAPAPQASPIPAVPVVPPAAAPMPQRQFTRLLAASQLVSGLPRDMFKEPAPKIALEVNSYATPLRGDAVEWSAPTDKWQEHAIVFPTDSVRLTPAAVKTIRALVANARPGSRFEILGRDDEGHKERVAETRASSIASALVSAGAARANISQKTTAEAKEAGKGLWVGATVRVYDVSSTASPAVKSDLDVASVVKRLQTGKISPSEAIAILNSGKPVTTASVSAVAPGAAPSMPSHWAVRKTDETIERMLERWGRESGWRVVWQGGPTVAITGDSTLQRPDFIQAADYVVNQAKTAGYRIRATAYSNQTLVITGE